MADMAREAAAAGAFVGAGGTAPKAEAPIELDAAQYGELKPYKPSIQDRLGAALVDLGLPRGSVDGLVGSSGVGRSGPGGMGLADFSPFGALFAVDETFRAKTDAERTAAIMGVVPGSRPAGKAAKEGVRAIRAYHGSPHSFDAFDSSKIGTGEGAQAYGHGLYFAESEGVARSYRDALAPVPDRDPVANAYNLIHSYGQDKDFLIQQFEDVASRARDPKQAEFLRASANAIRTGAVDTYKPPGHMYEVNIHANPDDFLDLETPLADQKSLEPALRRYFGRDYERATAGPYAADGFTFKDLATDPVHAASNVEEMRQAGISGIRFLDQVSRAGGDGTRNYVVFPGNDHLIEVVRKYGVIGLLGSGAAAAMVNDGTGQAQARGAGSYTTAGGV